MRNEQNDLDLGPKKKGRRRACRFCADPEVLMTYRDAKGLVPFLTYNHKIMPRRISRASARSQRMLKVAIKRARYMALLPYS